MVSVSVSKKNYQKKYQYWFRKILVSKKVSDSVSKNSGIEKSIGIGIGKNLVSKKVSDSVSKKFGIGKKFRIRFRSDFGYRHTLRHSFTLFRSEKPLFRGVPGVPHCASLVRICPRDHFPCRKKKIYLATHSLAGRVNFVISFVEVFSLICTQTA